MSFIFLRRSRGPATWVARALRFSVPPGQLVIVPPGVVHDNQKLECTSRTIFLEFKALRDAVEQFVERSIPGLDFRPGLIDDKRTVKDFLKLHRSLEGPRFELEQENSLILFLCRLVTGHSGAQVSWSREGNEDFAVQRAKRLPGRALRRSCLDSRPRPVSAFKSLSFQPFVLPKGRNASARIPATTAHRSRKTFPATRPLGFRYSLFCWVF